MTDVKRIEQVMGGEISNVQPLSGGCVGNVIRFTRDGVTWVAKTGDADSGLDIEGRMLTYLKQHTALPVPGVAHAAPELLVIEFVDHDGCGAGGVHAADLLGALHAIQSETYGLEFDTLIGGLHQPNGPLDSWIDFFGERRLRHMTATAISRGRLPPEFGERVSAMIDRLPSVIDEPSSPSLIHGDVWGGNVLVENGRVAAFIDPAIYYGHWEVELAFVGMFNTFGDDFYDAYPKAIDGEFFSTRRDVYNLYPLLVHVCLFGGSYVRSVDRTLRRFGC